MNIPTEKNIETYILNRTALTEKEQEWIQDWIQKDEEVRLLAEWFRVFYKKMDHIESVQERPDLLTSIIELEPAPQKSKYSGNVFVLAAQTPVADRRKKTLKTIRTFVSEEHKTLIRILHNSSKNQFKLHVISEFLQDDDIVLIDVGDQNNKTLVSDPGGTFVIPDQVFPENTIKNWQKCELHLPISKIRVFSNGEQGTLNFDTTEAHFEREELSLQKSGDKLQVSFNCSVERIPDKMVIYVGEKSSMWPVENGKCTIAIQNLSSPVSSLFFYK
ncbi:hypothetical protein [Rhodohalobacter sulfatireducens]|uniref:Uncharacterized protein n=1 Tax=Rhodohalobacter sulfatireducens TaxID=2911366 RepID=A0ABS9KC87_9BACT|nr:hypothetical protein [Rhodohalobacter sulfatireducens]MCG2588467.1 hypothetical protein [Rhodohalobacter sulfatireducens]